MELLYRVSSVNESKPGTLSQREDWKRSSLLPGDSDYHSVGIDSKVDDMMRLLDSPSFPIIVVVGMGGMGKTHLLQHVFNTTKERYEKSIWLSVSQSYSVSKLQCDIASHLGLYGQIRGGNEGVTEQRAAELINEKLQEKRCLVVLDDVWRGGGEDDLLARLGLPGGHNSPCKIVVTTRSREVCGNWNAQVYEMKYLSDEDSWVLFCVYAFEEGKQPPQHNLEQVGRMIVKKCGNLPLAIKTITASLAKTTVPRVWESKLQQLEGVQGTANIDPIMPILRLSYDSLSQMLKACFSYISFFPEDEEIDYEYLVNLWIGEGFIPAGESQWDTAWDCLYQLANLCLIQLWEDECLTKYCRIHDLLLDLAKQVSRENKCAFSVEEAFKDATTGWCRILLGRKYINDDDISEIHPVCLRTISVSQNERIASIPSNLFTAMRGLRVLDLSMTNISALPENAGKLKLLKVLNLSTEIREVPECVRHLKSLLFLRVSHRCSKLPVWMGEVKCLEHLECFGVSQVPRGISELVSLRTLRSDWLDMSIEEGEFTRSEDLATLTQLQELRLNVNHEMEREGILGRLPVKMRHLFIHNKTGIELLELPEKMTAMKDLETLNLKKFVVPDWICGFANLKELKLVDCSDYPELQIMPNLVKLVFSGDSRCRELLNVFGKAGLVFPRLRFFTIHELTELEEFPEFRTFITILQPMVGSSNTGSPNFNLLMLPKRVLA